MSIRKLPFRSVGLSPNKDVIKTLQALLAEAQSGDLLGVCYAAMYKRREYATGICGECAANPTFARGMVAELHDELGKG